MFYYLLMLFHPSLQSQILEEAESVSFKVKYSSRQKMKRDGQKPLSTFQLLMEIDYDWTGGRLKLQFQNGTYLRIGEESQVDIIA